MLEQCVSITTYPERGDLPQRGVVGVAVFRVVQLGQVYPTPLGLIVKQNVSTLVILKIINGTFLTAANET